MLLNNTIDLGVMLSESQGALFYLATQLQRINHLGNVHTIQIELDLIPERKKKELAEVFIDASTVGQYKDGMIILQMIVDRDLLEIIESFHYIQKILGDLKIIEGITALVEIEYKGNHYYIVVTYIPRNNNLELISTSDNALYYELLNYVKTRWAFSKTFVK